jgi:hypothetical protein
MSTQQPDQLPPNERAGEAPPPGSPVPSDAVPWFQEGVSRIKPLPPEDPFYQQGPTPIIRRSVLRMTPARQGSPRTPPSDSTPSTTSASGRRFGPPIVTDWALLDALLKWPRSGSPPVEEHP